MRQVTRRFPIVLAPVLVALLVAPCGTGPSPSASSGAVKPPTGPDAAAVTLAPTTPPDLTPVPGGSTDGPVAQQPLPTRPSTTATEWGTVLDSVPADFPVFPGAAPVDAVDGPASGAWQADAPVDTVATWYRDDLERLGFTTIDLSSALEDGSRVLDSVSDLPECRIQTTFRPAGESTMIIVLYGAGCAGGEG